MKSGKTPGRVIAGVAGMALLAGISYFTARHFASTAEASAPISVAPFTFERVTTSFRSGEPKVTEVRTIARRSDGTEATLQVLPSSPKDVMRSIKYTDGRASSLFERFKAKVSGFMSRRDRLARIQRLVNPPDDCAWPGEEAIRHEAILGQSAVVVRRKSPKSRSTQWRLPDFGCVSVQKKWERRQPDGSWRLEIQNTPRYFFPGEPMASLFDSEQDLDEVRPSELRRRMYEHYGDTQGDCPECLGVPTIGEWDRKMDTSYEKAQMPDWE